MPDASLQLEQSIVEFIRAPDSHAFDDLALRIFGFLYEQDPGVREQCQDQGVEPGSIRHWTEIPTLIKTSTASSVPVPFGGLQKIAIESVWAQSGLASLGRPPFLSLLPEPEGENGLVDKAPLETLMERLGGEQSLTGTRGHRVDAKKARGFLAARQRDGQPVVIFATSGSVVDLLQSLARLDLRFRISTSSILVEFDDVPSPVVYQNRNQMAAAVQEYLALPRSRIVRALSLHGGTTQLFTGVLDDGDPALLLQPHWIRFGAVDKESGDPIGKGESGVLRILDLANLGLAFHCQTDLEGHVEPGGFRLAGD